MTAPTALDPGFALSVVAKATLVLAAAALAHASLRRASAASRHLLWVLALATLPLLPALSLVLPAWTLPVERPSPPPVAGGPGGLVVAAAPAALAENGARPSSRAEPPGAFVDDPRPADAGKGGYAGLLSWAVYLAGVLLLFSRVVVDWSRMRRLRRDGEPVTDPEWTGMLANLARDMGITAEVSLVRSGETRVPLTWSTRAPVVLIPEDADAWPAGRRRAVLLHELAHVARRDSLTQTLASLVSALYWFHPGVWWAVRRLRIERELACDDEVLRAGTAPHEYAGHLLDIARNGWAPSPSLGLSMARPTQLEARMVAILDPRRPRSAPARSTTGILAATAVSLLLAISTGAVAEGRALALSSRGAPAPPGDPRATPGDARVEQPLAPVAAPEMGDEERGREEPIRTAIQDADSVVIVSRDGALRVILERDAIRVRVTEGVYRQLTGEPAAQAASTGPRGMPGFPATGSAARYLDSWVNRSIGLYNLRDVVYRDGSLILVRREAPDPLPPPGLGARSGVYTIERIGLEPAQVEPFLRAARERIQLWSAVAGRVNLPGADGGNDVLAWDEMVRAEASNAQTAMEVERAIARQARPTIMWGTIEPWLENEERRLPGDGRPAAWAAFERVKRAWRLLDARRTLEPDLTALEASPQAEAFRTAMERYIGILEAP